MPVMVVLLFLSGFFLFDFRRNGFQCVGTLSGKLLLVKVALAFAVLGVFTQTVWTGARGKLDICHFRNTYRIVLAMMVVIVVIAKLMFSSVVPRISGLRAACGGSSTILPRTKRNT